MYGMESSTFGTFTPFLLETIPPFITVQTISIGILPSASAFVPDTFWIFLTSRPISPSSIRMVSPGFTSSGRSLYVIATRLSSPTISSVVRVNVCPFFSSTLPLANSFRRISGPFVSSRAATGRFISSRSLRSIVSLPNCSSCPPCEKLKRATFMPSSIRLRITFSSSVDGPNVHTIFVFLNIIFLSLFCHFIL